MFVTGYGLSFPKNMGKNIDKNVSGKYSQKLLSNAKKSTALHATEVATDAV